MSAPQENAMSTGITTGSATDQNTASTDQNTDSDMNASDTARQQHRPRP